MNVVVDSSAWIEWLIQSSTGKALAPHMPAPEDCIVPTLVQFEVLKWLLREADEEQGDAFIAYTLTCDVEPLSTEIALEAVVLARHLKLATADAIVLATARIKNAELLTCDAHFAGLEGVKHLAKT